VQQSFQDPTPKPRPGEDPNRVVSGGRSERVLAVCVNYRTVGLAQRLLHSLALERTRVPNLSVVVVDNDSGDGSVAELERLVRDEGWQGWARVLSSERNGGFAFGNNLGVSSDLAREQGADYYLLINPDCEASPGMLVELLREADPRPKAGYLGPYSEIGRGNHRNTAFRFPGILSHLDDGLRFGPLSRLLAPWVLSPAPRTEVHSTDWLSGGCLLVRREVFEQVGPMDEEYFLYYEEVDHMFAASKLGWESWYVPQAKLLHDSGASTGVTGEKEHAQRIPLYWLESRARFLKKNRGTLVKLLCDLAWSGGSVLRLLRCTLWGRSSGDPPRFFRDFVSFNLLGRRNVGR
jgi:N-acetylglucosaminyl-diphospho-decaprenol L-rhamnosyltransferase